MKESLRELWSKFLNIFGDIKVFKWPLFMVYDPVLYQVSGRIVARC